MRMRIRHRRRAPDEGAVLVLVLLFVLVISLVIGAVIEQARVSIGGTVVVRNQQALTFAADSGLEQALQKVRRDSRLCARAGGATSLGTVTSNGRSVQLSCDFLDGGGAGVLGYAVVAVDTTDPGNDCLQERAACVPSLTTAGGGTKTITGPVWAGKATDLARLRVRGGDFAEGACDNSNSVPAGLSFVPVGAYSYTCGSVPRPTFAPSLPDTVPAPAPAPIPPTAIGDCRTFFPGTYTAATWPGLLERNYFVSGVYYFLNVPLAVSGTQEVVGGRRGAREPDSLNIDACSNDLAQPGALPSDTDTGVKWIFGGSTSLTTTSSGGTMEMFARRGGATSEGTQGVPIMQVPSGTTSPWTASTLGLADDIITVSSGSNPSFVVHGIVYTPDSRINVDNAANISNAQFQGGILTGRLHLQAPENSSGLVVSMESDQAPRLVRITATTQLESGDKPITASTVVWIEDDEQRTTHIQSWRSTN